MQYIEIKLDLSERDVSERILTYSRLFLAPKWNVVVQHIVLIDPYLSSRPNQYRAVRGARVLL